MKKLWYVGWTLVVMFATSAITLISSAILFQDDQPGGIDDKLGGLGGMFVVLVVVGTICMGAWTADYKPQREQKLPRSHRKQLKTAQADAELQRRIKLLERENEIVDV